MATRPDSIPHRAASRTALVLLAGLALGSLAVSCGKEAPADELVAKVGDHPITVEDAADYMKRTGRGANMDEVKESVNLLVDLQLVLQRSRANHDLTPAESLQVHEWRNVLTMNQFREDEIWKDVQVDEAKLHEWYDQNVGPEVHVRHILIGVQPSASDSAKARAKQLADSLHQAIQNGADMADLAKQYSDDPGSAKNGGLLDWFSHGQMVEPFEKAAFNTPEGELAPVVETQFGYHVLRVEGKRKPTFESLRDQIEDEVATPERNEAEKAYVENLMENSGIEFQESNVDKLISLIHANPPQNPSDDERDLSLATWKDGGKISLGEIWDLYQVLPEGNRRAIQKLDQAGMIQALSSIVQQRLLLAEAETAKTRLDSTRQSQLDERVDQLYTQSYLRQAAQAMMNVPDSTVRAYYDSHKEFYSGQPYEQVSDQIRQTLQAQRMQAMNDPDAQRKLISSVADSEAADVKVEKYQDHYDDVLTVLKSKYAEEGDEAPTESPSVRPAGNASSGASPAPADRAPAPAGTSEGARDATSGS